MAVPWGLLASGLLLGFLAQHALGTRARAAKAASFWRGKRVLLTGASSGLGEALAVSLSRRGAVLVLAARREMRLSAVAAACAEQGSALPGVVSLDLTQGAAAIEARAADATRLLGGRVDVLLCAAGVGQRTDAVSTSAEVHRTLMATNFEGPVVLARALLPAMLARGSGHLAVVSSVQGRFGQPFRSSYAASKSAVIGYFDAVRAEVAARGVLVTLIERAPRQHSPQPSPAPPQP